MIEVFKLDETAEISDVIIAMIFQTLETAIGELLVSLIIITTIGEVSGATTVARRFSTKDSKADNKIELEDSLRMTIFPKINRVLLVSCVNIM